MSVLNENIELDDIVILENIRSLQPNNYDLGHIGWSTASQGYYKPLPNEAELDNGILRCNGYILYWCANTNRIPPAMDYIKSIECPNITIGGVRKTYPHILRGQNIKVGVNTRDDVEQLDAVGEYVFISTHGAINKCNIRTTTLCIGAGIQAPINSNIICERLKFHNNDVFTGLDFNIHTQNLICDHIILHRHYKSWVNVRAVINNPIKFQGLLPEHPKLWFKIRSFDELMDILGLSDIQGLNQITFQDHTIMMQFRRLPDGDWDVSFFRNGKLAQ